MQVSGNSKDQNWNVARDSTTIELVRMELLLKLDGREPSVLARVVNVAGPS